MDTDDNGKAVAMTHASCTRSNEVVINGLYIIPDLRRAGLATRMVEAAVYEARQEWGSTTFRAQLLHNNARLVGLFEGIGFTVTNVRIIGRSRYARIFGEYALMRVDPDS